MCINQQWNDLHSFNLSNIYPSAVTFWSVRLNKGLISPPCLCSLYHQFGLTFSAVFGVIIYRITISALMAMSPDPDTKSNVRVTVTSTAVIINLVVILILDEIYGSVALWLTELGTKQHVVALVL